MSLIARLDEWLTPARRKLIHGTIATLGALLVITGAVREDVVTGAAGIATAALGVGSQVLATIKARRTDVRRLYAAVAALIVSLRLAGVITDGTESHWLDIGAALAAMLGPWLAASRTDPTTATGEPAAEVHTYQPRH